MRVLFLSLAAVLADEHANLEGRCCLWPPNAACGDCQTFGVDTTLHCHDSAEACSSCGEYTYCWNAKPPNPPQPKPPPQSSQLSAAPLLPPQSDRLPANWSDLCIAREAVVEQLLNLALRLQAYGRAGGPPSGSNVLKAVAEGLNALRSSTLAIVEAVEQWQVRVHPT